jgi:hypothetical protein
MSKETIAERYKKLDSKRHAKVERSRFCSSLTVPSLLPPYGWTEETQLPQPYSSVASKGVTSMASRMLSALLPLNDMPFFKFEQSTGMAPDPEIRRYLEALSYQVYNKLASKNLRDILYQVLQHLIVTGDCVLIMEDDYSFRMLRLDQYVCRRDVKGELLELIHLEFVTVGNDVNLDERFPTDQGMMGRQGYETIYCKLTAEEDGTWKMRKENSEGELVDEGVYTTNPYIVLRWTGVPGENYGRSHCEDLIGDIKTLEAFTEGLIEGVAAGSCFWVGVDPAGITEIQDIAGAHNGAIIGARQQDVFTISPSGTMSPQIQATQTGVETMRRELGKAFLMDSASIPTGDRVTATAVRMVGQELENVLGGAFSSIARMLMKPIVERTVFLMIADEEIDSRIADEFTEDGELTVEIVTGLQALSRDSDLQKLMQMGEMVRNLPEQAMQTFRWDEYGRALISSLGFNADNWIKSEDDAYQQQLQQQQDAAAIQGQAQTAQMMQQAVAQAGQQAAMQEIEQGGLDLNQLMGQAGNMTDPAQLQAMQEQLATEGGVV